MQAYRLLCDTFLRQPHLKEASAEVVAAVSRQTLAPLQQQPPPLAQPQPITAGQGSSSATWAQRAAAAAGFAINPPLSSEGEEFESDDTYGERRFDSDGEEMPSCGRAMWNKRRRYSDYMDSCEGEDEDMEDEEEEDMYPCMAMGMGGYYSSHSVPAGFHASPGPERVPEKKPIERFTPEELLPDPARSSHMLQLGTIHLPIKACLLIPCT